MSFDDVNEAVDSGFGHLVVLWDGVLIRFEIVNKEVSTGISLNLSRQWLRGATASDTEKVTWREPTPRQLLHHGNISLSDQVQPVSHISRLTDSGHTTHYEGKRQVIWHSRLRSLVVPVVLVLSLFPVCTSIGRYTLTIHDSLYWKSTAYCLTGQKLWTVTKCLRLPTMMSAARRIVCIKHTPKPASFGNHYRIWRTLTSQFKSRHCCRISSRYWRWRRCRIRPLVLIVSEELVIISWVLAGAVFRVARSEAYQSGN